MHLIFADTSVLLIAASQVACEQNYKNYRNQDQRSVKQFLKSKSAFKNNIYTTVALTQIL